MKILSITFKGEWAKIVYKVAKTGQLYLDYVSASDVFVSPNGEVELKGLAGYFNN